MAEFFSQVNIHAARQFAFAWHEQPHALDRLIPPWERLELVSRTGGIQAGEVNLRKKVGPFWMGFKAIHSQFIKSEQFFDQMSGGPFSHWEHLHRFETEKSDQCVLHDEVSYRLRGGFLGKLLASRLVRNRLEQLFAYRRQITQHEIEDHFRFATVGTKSIAVTGAGGLLGKSICQLLANGGHRVIKLPRVNSTEPGNQVGWNPETGVVIFPPGDSAVDCFLHLAGYGIAKRRWNSRVKDLIHNSRVQATEKLARFLLEKEKVTQSFVCASASGFYGDRGDEILDEDSNPGQGFLAETCQAWEAATDRLQESGLRTVNMRLGIVLSAKGGALDQMLFPFKMGLGGRIGSGKQVWSWVSFFDALRAIHFSIMNPEIRGPVNFCSPEPLSQGEFSNCLGKVLFRPTLFPMPAVVARLLFGEMAESLLLAGARVVPKKLTDCGFRFVHRKLEDALRFELGRIRVKRQDGTIQE